MYRTFETRLALTAQQFDIIERYAALLGTIERTIYSRLRRGRAWKGDLRTSVHREFGVHSAVVAMVHRQLLARLKSAHSVSKLHRDQLKRRLWQECLRLEIKKKRISQTDQQAARTRKRLAEAAYTFDSRPQQLTAAQLRKLKNALDRKFHCERRLKILAARKSHILRSIHFAKRKIQKIASRLKRAECETAEPRLHFAPGKLFLAQHHLQASGFSSHEEWQRAWREALSSKFFLEGDKSTPSGNRYARLHVRRGLYDLELRLPAALAAGADRSEVVKGRIIYILDVRGLNFHHGRDSIQRALNKGAPVTVRFHKDDVSWKVSVTVYEETNVPRVCWDDGAVGLDWNAGKIVAAMVDGAGNLIKTNTFACPTAGGTANQTKEKIRKVCSQIAAFVKTLHVPLVIEKLDFAQVRSSRRAFADKTYARRVALYPYAQFTKAMTSASARQGIPLSVVASAHTTRVGRYKFARRYGLSTHEAAAFVIARRGMKFSERLNGPTLQHERWQSRPMRPTVTHVERKARKSGGKLQPVGDREGGSHTEAVSTMDVETTARPHRRLWRSVKPLHSLSVFSGRSLGNRFSRGSEGWEPRRE
ncbi:hypothetical protein [Rhizobium sp. S163]|uniref:hypothetical protein n=1 Tax=Rhizobium sp. S163 TaxID=3055039 RepID=UPI0025A9600D|nr:hypothetical protein [Rhizobium sp. S163]MDM9646337.1 hypothetical protein [Rhizobium sp. S163]